MRRARLRAIMAALLAAAIILTMVASLIPQQAGAQTTSTTTAVTAPPPPDRSRSEVNAELNVLEASSDEIEAAINRLDTQLAAERAAAEQADFEVLAAQLVVDQAQAEVDAAQAEADRTADEVRKVAVEAYVNPPSEQMIAILVSANATEARQRQSYLKSKAADRAEALEARQAALDALDAKKDAAAGARDEAQAAANERDAAVAAIESSRAAQQEMADQISGKIASGLAEIAALDAIDRAHAASLAVEQARLVAAVARVTTPPTTAPAPQLAGDTVPTPTPPPTTSPPTTARPVTTVPPVVTPPPLVGPADLRTVAGFVVNKSIATAFGDMIAASQTAGIVLGGGAYRDPAAQIATRRNNCGPTDYDIWIKPASQCSPPTARPGTSMHEQGLAIDFTCSGSLITVRAGDCWNWLATNAATYGFYNLPSEPWHWSVNGH